METMYKAVIQLLLDISSGMPNGQAKLLKVYKNTTARLLHPTVALQLQIVSRAICDRSQIPAEGWTRIQVMYSVAIEAVKAAPSSVR